LINKLIVNLSVLFFRNYLGLKVQAQLVIFHLAWIINLKKKTYMTTFLQWSAQPQLSHSLIMRDIFTFSLQMPFFLSKMTYNLLRLKQSKYYISKKKLVLFLQTQTDGRWPSRFKSWLCKEIQEFDTLKNRNGFE